MKIDLAVVKADFQPTSKIARKLSICLINPRFEPSYWGFDFALPLYPGDKRSTMISGSLPTVAGLCGDHDVLIVDENIEEIDWASLAAFDIVGVTGYERAKEADSRDSRRTAKNGDLHRRGWPLRFRCRKHSSTASAT